MTEALNLWFSLFFSRTTTTTT